MLACCCSIKLLKILLITFCKQTSILHDKQSIRFRLINKKITSTCTITPPPYYIRIFYSSYFTLIWKKKSFSTNQQCLYWISILHVNDRIKSTATSRITKYIYISNDITLCVIFSNCRSYFFLYFLLVMLCHTNKSMCYSAIKYIGARKAFHCSFDTFPLIALPSTKPVSITPVTLSSTKKNKYSFLCCCCWY